MEGSFYIYIYTHTHTHTQIITLLDTCMYIEELSINLFILTFLPYHFDTILNKYNLYYRHAATTPC